MNGKPPDDIHGHGEYCPKVARTYEGFASTTHKEDRFLSETKGTGDLSEPWSCATLPLSETHETYCTVQAILLACSILVLSYNAIRYGRTEFSLLENGKAVNVFSSSNRVVITLNLGYSPAYAAISAIAASMLLYSLIIKKAEWSLPVIILNMADLICDVGDALVAAWLFFGNLPLTTAIFYTVGIISIVLGEFWIWLGVLQLYEHRSFQ